MSFPSKRNLKAELIVSLLLAMIILVTYRQVQYNDFIDFDDNAYVTENVNLHKGISFESITWALTSCDVDYWHPLVWLSHMIDFRLFGSHPRMHHFVNLLFHFLNAALLFIFLYRGTGSAWKSALVSGLFAVHPLNVESVAWVAERKNVLSAFFWMLCLIAYGHYTRRPGRMRYLSVVFLFCLGLMCKPMLVTLPFVLFLLDYWPLSRFRLSSTEDRKVINISALVLEKIPLMIISAMTIVFFMQRIGYSPGTGSLPLTLKISNALVSYVRYIWKLIWPADFSIFYPYPESIPTLRVFMAGVFLLFITFLMAKKAKSKPYMIVGWLWYLGTLIPVMGIVQIGLWPAFADRFVYLPMIGLLIMAVWGISDWIQIRWIYQKIMVVVATAAIFGFLMTASSAQVQNWKNGKVLFEHAVDATRNNWLAHSQLGAVLAREGDQTQAIFHLKKAALLKPDYILPLYNLAGVYKERGDDNAAMFYYRQVLKIKPNHSDARNNIGVLLNAKGDVDGAMRQYRIALKANPENARPHCNIANLLSDKGRLDEAVFHYLEAIRIDPDEADFHYNLGGVLLKQKRSKEAMFRFSEAIRIDPAYAPAYYQIGLLFVQLGENKTARSFFEKTIQLDPHLKEAKHYLDALGQ
jgi:protein O-mannosyl-transferase